MASHLRASGTVWSFHLSLQFCDLGIYADEMKFAVLWWIFDHKNMQQSSEFEQRGNRAFEHV